jgi:predicted  nucleic acid-binding Zn-ribbon protein
MLQNADLVLFGFALLGPVAMLLGIVLYRQLAEHLANLPAAAAWPDIGERVRLRQAELDRLQEEVRLAHSRLGELEAQRSEADYWRARVEEAKAELEALGPRRAEIDAVERELAELREALADVEGRLGERRAEFEVLGARIQQVGQETARLEGERNAVREELERSRKELETGQSTLTGLRNELAEAATRLAGAQAAVGELEERRHRLEGALAERPQIEAEVKALQARLIEARDALARIDQELLAARAELDRAAARREDLDAQWRSLEAELGRQREEKSRLAAEIAALEATRGRGDDGGGGSDDDPIVELRQGPGCFRAGRAVAGADEASALERLSDHLDAVGLKFPPRTLEAFHTCLKIADLSPLTVLAGISGTGKSELPRRYAEALGLEFLLVPVQPRWDGPQDLLGFYNYLEHRFKATELTQALVRLDPRNWSDLGEHFEDRMLLVLLDEMNLARVEYYFSDFLSLLEIRRASPGRAEVHLDIGRQGRRALRLEPNALFVGTMNEDESTQTLSDKVLDRANQLRFTRPRRFARAAPAGAGSPADGWLPRRVWQSWHRGSDALDTSARSRLEGWIGRLNDILDRLGRPFGHRVQQAILEYAANHPAVGRNPVDGVGMAFVDQLELRTLPKLRGLDTRIAQSGLDDLERLLREPELSDDPVLTAFNQARQAELFAWPGAAR